MNAAFQKAIFEALVADAGVGALIGDRIFDRMPSDADYPCVTFGPSDAVTDDADCVPGTEETIQIDVWTRDQGRTSGCKRITRAVYDALHEADLTIDAPWALVETRVAFTRVMLDPDGVTAHGVLSVTGMIEG